MAARRCCSKILVGQGSRVIATEKLQRLTEDEMDFLGIVVNFFPFELQTKFNSSSFKCLRRDVLEQKLSASEQFLTDEGKLILKSVKDKLLENQKVE